MSLNRVRHQAISTPYGNALWAASYGSEVLGWAIEIGEFRQTSGADVATIDPSPFFDTRDAVEVRTEMDCDGRFTSLAHIPHMPYWLGYVMWDDEAEDSPHLIVALDDDHRERGWFDYRPHGEHFRGVTLHNGQEV
jgi:hypothetical protein